MPMSAEQAYMPSSPRTKMGLDQLESSVQSTTFNVARIRE